MAPQKPPSPGGLAWPVTNAAPIITAAVSMACIVALCSLEELQSAELQPEDRRSTGTDQVVVPR